MENSCPTVAAQHQNGPLTHTNRELQIIVLHASGCRAWQSLLVIMKSVQARENKLLFVAATGCLKQTQCWSLYIVGLRLDSTQSRGLQVRVPAIKAAKWITVSPLAEDQGCSEVHAASSCGSHSAIGSCMHDPGYFSTGMPPEASLCNNGGLHSEMHQPCMHKECCDTGGSRITHKI